MQNKRKQIIFGGLLVILLTGGLIAGLILTQKPQTAESEAAEEQSYPTLPGYKGAPQEKTPLKGDFNGDGKVDAGDRSLFMIKFRAQDPGADLDNSGQVNTLDLTLFKQLCGC